MQEANDEILGSDFDANKKSSRSWAVQRLDVAEKEKGPPLSLMLSYVRNISKFM